MSDFKRKEIHDYIYVLIEQSVLL